ncbi:putative elongator complex protein 1 [Basidiobolus ranarum]|uniref:Elongator complex protein 1 n=1 Tax=Basidiobolus ranarum TaxID=34480 RepID=A0ABR2W0N8_9FUNG
MKNLILANKIAYSLPVSLPSDSYLRSLQACFDSVERDTYVAHKSEHDNEVKVLLLSERENWEEPSLTELASLPLGENFNEESSTIPEGVVGIRFLLELQAVCVALSNGDIYLIKKDGSPEEMVECVGSVEIGICAMEWSPDEELVLFITGKDTMLLMTKDFDVLGEHSIHVEEIGEDAQVNVGWGKKETQFHGSEGKQAALKRADTSSFTLSSNDDRQPRVSWRGDGNFFVVSIIDKSRGIRILRMYSREGVLQNTSEPVDKLEHVCSWKPSGSLITGSQLLPHKHDIVFFERNGLRHGEFSLREKDAKIVEIFWNSDSSVLAIWLENENRTVNKSCIQLWTMNNYHWYLKQEIGFDAIEGPIVQASWDVESALRLHIFTHSGCYHQYNYCWDHFVSGGASANETGMAAVIDGSSLLLTPFKFLNVPPPMSAFEIECEYPVSNVSFCSGAHVNNFATLNTNGSISLYETPFSKTTSKPTVPRLLGSFDTKEKLPCGTLKQIAWINPRAMVAIQSQIGKQDSLVLMHVQCEPEVTLLSVESIDSHTSIIRLYHNSVREEVLIESANGEIYQLDCEPGNFELMPFSGVSTLSEPCTWITSARIGSSPETSVEALIAQSDRNKLYVNNTLLASDCTSFYVTDHFLIYTTVSHIVRFIPLNIDIEEFKVPTDNTLKYDETIRRVERGSKIVAAISSSMSLVLQMPRGNLETVYPRAMVLSAVRESLDRLDYRSAFVDCRKHRLDLNILYDHSPDAFMENVALLVTQIKDVDYLNLFLSSLSNEDVTVTMYPMIFDKATRNKDQSKYTNKVNIICDAIRAQLNTLDTKKFMQPIITTYVKKTPPELEEALTLLREIKKQDSAAADDALKYTIFLVDVNLLHDVALGMYDFELVLMVAQQSQKDPREYLPFLTELQQLEQYYQRYRIDDHLGRHSKALMNLNLAGNQYFDDCLEYIKKYNLYVYALELFSTDSEKHNAVLDIYGDFLHTQSQFEEAGISYMMCGKLEKALESYQRALCWQEVFSLVHQLKYDDSEVAALGRSLASQLKDKRMCKDAAVILLDYVKDPEEAVDTLTNGNLWNEALRISNLYDRSDLIETHIKPGLVESFNHLNEDISEMNDQLSKQTTRLAEIRAKKAQEASEMELASDMLDNIDVMSDTTSMASDFSRYTKASTRMTSLSSKSGKTAKSRKKKEKRLRGKKGSAFEEEYLMDSLKRLILRFNVHQAESKSLVKHLALFGHSEKAREIQKKMLELHQTIKSSMDSIFVAIIQPTQAEILVLQQTGMDPPTPVEKPILIFEDWNMKFM